MANQISVPSSLHESTGNGNGRHTGLARTDASLEDELMPPPPWLAALQTALSDSIKPDDLTEIMKAQVNKARSGDLNAANFVMNQAHKLMQSSKKPVTIVQNNYYTDENPAQPIEAPPDSNARLRRMEARRQAHLPLVQDRDRDPRAVSDEEEKEMRRRQESAEE